MLEAGVDPRRAILVDWVHSLAVDAPPERSGTLYVDGRWFAFTAGEDSPVGRSMFGRGALATNPRPETDTGLSWTQHCGRLLRKHWEASPR